MHSKMLGLILSIVFAPAVVFLSLVIFLATIGKSFGVRRLYIKVLLLIFEVRLQPFSCSSYYADYVPVVVYVRVYVCVCVSLYKYVCVCMMQ